MTELQVHQTEWLEPLRAYYAAVDAPLPSVSIIGSREIPQPYHDLLVHRQDMTSVLERYHGGTIGLRLLRSQAEGDLFTRQVVLVMAETGRPVEFGAIHIHLDGFGQEAQRAILDCRRPLGSILKEYDVSYLSNPRALLLVRSDAVMSPLLGVAGEHQLFGRYNVLSDPAGRPLAEVIEILPPVEPSASNAG